MAARLATERLAVLLAGVTLATAIAYGSAQAPLLMLGALAATGFALLVLLNAEAVLLGFVMVLPWSELLNWPTETITVVKLAGLVLVFAYLLRLVQNREAIEAPPTLLPAALFVLISGISLMVADSTEGGLVKWLSYVQFAVFFFVFVQLVRTKPQITRVIRAIVLSASAAALWGFVAFVQRDVDRASGPISDPNDFAYLLAVLFPLALYLVARDRGWRPLWSASVLILAAAMMATLSRGVLVAFLALAVWAIAFRKVPVSVTVSVAGAAVGVALFAVLLWGPLIEQRVEQKGAIASDNVASRSALWTAGLEMAADNPLLGVGPAQFGPISKAYIEDQPVALENPVAHNSYVEVLAEGGILSLAAFVAFLGGSWVLAIRGDRTSRKRGDPDGAALALAIQSSLLIAFVGAMFVSEQAAIPIWLGAALAVAAASAAGRGSGAGAPASS